MTKIYVTKYALTVGMFSVNADISPSKKSAFWTDTNGYKCSAYGKDFWLTPEEAIVDCERRRATKLKSLEKTKQKIENLNFNLIKEYL